MEIGGLVLYAFKIVFGNPDVMAVLIAFSIFIAFTFTGLEIYRRSRG